MKQAAKRIANKSSAEMRIRMTLEELFDKCINEHLIDLIISGKKKKDYKIEKIKIRPVLIQARMVYQASEFVENKVLHVNYTQEEVKLYITKMLKEHFKQAQFKMTDIDAQVLSSKSGKMTIRYKKLDNKRLQKDMAHNRNKNYILKEGTAVEFLIDLGVMTKEGKICNSKYDKYKQINRFLEFIEDILPHLDKNKEQVIIDFGCGKSYLTFAMYYYLKELKGYPIRIIGLDLKEDVIHTCNQLKDKYGYDKLNFYVGDIASYKDVEQVDMVVTLHACDTATDYALAKAVEWGAKVILSVPCCQHEANKQIHSEELAAVLKYGVLKERISAIFTDAIRANLLEEAGYQTQILEFIDMEHTPKNLLIRAVYTGDKKNASGDMVQSIQHTLGLNLTLSKLLKGMVIE